MYKEKTKKGYSPLRVAIKSVDNPILAWVWDK